MRQAFPDLPTIDAWVEVRDLAGAAIANLKAVDFKASVDGKPISVTGLTPMANLKDKTAYILLVDRSSSMKSNKVFKNAVAVGNGLVDRLAQNDMMAVASFGESYVLEHPDFTGDKTQLKAALGQIVPDDKQTKLYDALQKVLVLLESTGKNPAFPKRKIVVLLTDGKDDGSTALFSDVTSLFSQIQIPIFSVGFKSRRQPSFPELEQLARQSGGLHVVEKDPVPIAAAIDQVVGAIDEGYLVQTRCDACQPTGARATLSVTLALKGAIQSNVLSVEMVQSPAMKARVDEEKALALKKQQQQAMQKKAAETSSPVWVIVVIVLGIVFFVILIRAIRKKGKADTEAARRGAAAGDEETKETPKQAEKAPQPAPAEETKPAPPKEPAGPSKPVHLEKIGGPGELSSGKTLRVTAKGVTIGRSAEVRLMNDDSVSSSHCRIRLDGSIVVVEDLGSSNGTVRNGYKIRSAERLDSGDELGIGTTRFRVGLEG